MSRDEQKGRSDTAGEPGTGQTAGTAGGLESEAESLLDGILSESDFSEKHPEFKRVRRAFDEEQAAAEDAPAGAAGAVLPDADAAQRLPIVSVSTSLAFGDVRTAGIAGDVGGTTDGGVHDAQPEQDEHPEQAEQPEQTSRPGRRRRFGWRRRSKRHDKADEQPGTADSDAQPEQCEQPGKSGEPEQAGTADSDAEPEQPDKIAEPEQPEQPDETGEPELSEHFGKTGGDEQPDPPKTRSARTIERRRSGLRRALFAVVACLVVLALAGLAIFSLLENGVGQKRDATQLDNSDAPASASFSALSSDALLPFADYFGQPVSDIVDASDGRLVLDGGTTASNDAEVPALASLQKAQLHDASGNKVASVAFGLDAIGKIVYVYCSGDLDALHVASAEFEALLADKTVAASYLVACGVRKTDAQAAALTLAENPDCRAESGTDGDSAAFSGSTGFTSAPTKWKLEERYDRTIGKALGDNSVMRTIAVELY